MPNGRYTVHFGVSPENVDRVIPGIVGIDTRRGPGTWNDWEDYPDDEQNRHIIVDTNDAFQMMIRILSTYGPLLRTRVDGYDDYRGPEILVVTDSLDHYAFGYEGTFALLAGIQQVPSRIQEMHRG